MPLPKFSSTSHGWPVRHTCGSYPLLAVLLWIWIFLVPDATAQSPVTSSSPPPTGSVAPIAIPDILTKTYTEQKQLDIAKRLLNEPDPVIMLRKKLDDIALKIDTQLSIANKSVLRELPIMRLESLARHLKFHAKLLDRWDVEANYFLTPYSDTALQLAQHRMAWSVTRAAGSIDALPHEVSANVEAMLREFDSTDAALAAVLAAQFGLRQRASEVEAQIHEASADIEAAIREIDRRLFHVDAPAIWHGLGSGSDTGSVVAVMQNGLEIERQFSLDYEAAGTSNNQARRIVQFLLIPLIFWLSIRAKRHHIQTGTSAQYNHSLSRPISTWFLLSMLFLLLLEPDAPILTQEFALLLGLIPILRLMPLGTLRDLGVWPYLAVALYVLDRTGVAFVTDVKFYRLFLLVLNGLALGLVIGILRSHPLASYAHQNPTRQGLVRLFGWAVLVILLIAAGCNVFGNVSMAETLTSGIIDSTYMGLLLYLGVFACLMILQTLFDQKELTQYRLLRRHTPALQLLFKRLLVLSAVIFWLFYFMERFRIQRPVQEFSTNFLAIGIEVGAVSIKISDVLVFMLSTWLAVWVAKAVRKLLMDELPGRAGLPRGVGNSIASLSYYGLLILGLLVALSAAGFEVSQLALIFGALGVGIGFGLQNVVNNFVSGLVLMFERPIQPGDVIDTAGISGTVREIGLRATILRTFDGADVVVPNGSLLSSNLTNWTMFDHTRRIEVPVGVAYGSDPAAVIAILITAARNTPGVAMQPEPIVLMTGYGDSALNFIARVWTSDVSTWMAVRGDLLERMLASLQEAGISIPYRQVDLNVRSMPEPLLRGAGLDERT